MRNSIAGQVVLVTGGARGMGAEHCRGIVAADAHAVIADVLDADGHALAAELGDAAAFVHLDVTDEQQWHEAVAFAEARFGPVHHLVNNAGIVAFGSIEQLSTADWRRTLDINLTGAWLGIRAAAPSIRRAGGGSIVNISSTAGLQGYPNIGAYVASKWGLRGLTKTAAVELAPDGIRVNSIHPGPVRTPMTAGMGDDVAFDAPIPRLGEPYEVTSLLLYLLADATFSTGHEFVVDGGATVGRNLATARNRRSDG
jgi:3alpha(or 20beta)-hydroxysteroid dehydrogenase